MNAIPYLLIIMLGIANCRYKVQVYNKIDSHDLLSILIATIGACVILL